MASIYDFELKGLDGEPVKLERFRGKVLLVVNVASRCGFVSQYAGLQKLWERYRERGFEILGFPCNQFGNQEPGQSEEIQQFCSLTYGVGFPMFEKLEVNGPGAHPLYAFLKESAPGILGSKAIKWNFTKFLVDREGQVVGRFPPHQAPEALAGEIEKLLPAAPR